MFRFNFSVSVCEYSHKCSSFSPFNSSNISLTLNNPNVTSHASSSAVANHPPSSLDWRRSTECRPWWGTGLCSWLHGTASSACRNHSPSLSPSLDHTYDIASESSCCWCWRWIQYNVGLCCLLLDTVNTGGNKLGTYGIYISIGIFLTIYVFWSKNMHTIQEQETKMTDTDFRAYLDIFTTLHIYIYISQFYFLSVPTKYFM